MPKEVAEANIREKNKITPIERDSVLDLIVGGKTVYAFRTKNATTVSCDDKAINTIREYLRSDEYLFFIVEEIK